MSAAADRNRVEMLVEAAPARPATFNGSHVLTDALVNAYYQRGLDAIRRIAHQVEARLQALEQPREAA